MSEQNTWSRRRLLGAGVGAVAAGWALSACNLDRASAPDNRPPDAGEGFMGTLVDPPYEKPDITLRTTDGQPFNLQTDTEGRLTLLFFGFTNCPDQCPIYLTTVAEAMKALRSGDGSSPLVLFVGVDVKRDTPEVLEQYLTNRNPKFVGLTGDFADIQAANDSFGFNPILIGEPEDPAKPDDYLVGHEGRFIAFTPDNLGHRLVGYDVRQAELVRDLPRLARGEYA